MGEIISAISGFGACFVLAVILYLNPEKFDAWLAKLLRLLSFIGINFKRQLVKHEIQGAINSYVKTLSDHADIDAVGAKIKWAGRDGDDEVRWDNDKVVLVMRDKGQQQRNYVHAAYLFTSTTLLKNVKKHLSKRQGQSLDLYTTGKIIEEHDQAAFDYFVTDIFEPLLQDEKINDMVEAFRDIDTSGYYTNVLLRELSYLGHKVIFSRDRTAVYEEVHNLIDFLRTFALREVGDMTTSDEFVGKFLRCSIKIVAMASTRERGNTAAPSDRICRAFSKGIENVYVIGPHPEGKDFMVRVCGIVMTRLDHIQALKKKAFKGTTTKGGHSKIADTYLIHLHNPKHQNLLTNVQNTHAEIEEFANELLSEDATEAEPA